MIVKIEGSVTAGMNSAVAILTLKVVRSPSVKFSPPLAGMVTLRV